MGAPVGGIAARFYTVFLQHNPASFAVSSSRPSEIKKWTSPFGERFAHRLKRLK